MLHLCWASSPWDSPCWWLGVSATELQRKEAARSIPARVDIVGRKSGDDSRAVCDTWLRLAHGREGRVLGHTHWRQEGAVHKSLQLQHREAAEPGSGPTSLSSRTSTLSP